MIKEKTSIRVTLWIGRSISVLVLLLLPLMPRILDWYARVRPLQEPGRYALFIGFCLCVPPVLVSLRTLDRLLGNILLEQVFTRDNVTLIRRIRSCCASVGLICFPAAWFYPPLIFMSVIMAFLSLVIGVVKNVMAAAVELREENDLTI